MRLTTLARKVELTPTNLLEFLTEHEIEVSKGINTILDEETVQLVKENFEFEEKSEPVQEDEEVEVTLEQTPEVEAELDETILHESQQEEENIVIEEEVISTEIVDVPQEDTFPETSEMEDAAAERDEQNGSDAKTATIDDLENDPEADVDLIKVKKVKLDGIKVVGKIDLPQKPKKDLESEDSDDKTEEDQKKEVRVKKAEKRKKSAPKRKKLKSTLTYEERLRRLEREKRKQLKIESRKEKEKKKKYYQEQVQSKVSGYSKKKKRKSKFSMRKREKVVVHKNPIKRLWDWLNGKYDRY